MAFEIVSGATGFERKQYLIENLKEKIRAGADPEKILALTHSSQTSKQIYEEIVPHLDSFKELWTDSITSFCKKILRENYYNADVKPGFRIISDFEKRLIVRAILKREENFKYFATGGIHNDGMIRELANFTDIAKRNINWKENIDKLNNSSGVKFKDIVKVVDLYDSALQKFNFLDFVDIEIHTAELLKNFPDTVDFKHIYIFEAEDMDRVTADFVSSLIQKAQDAFISFNGKEGIYDFRGGDPQYFYGNINKKFNFKEIQLKEKNIDLKENIIRSNTRDNQAEKVATHIAFKLKEGVSPNDIAIISRSVGEDMGVFTDALKRRGINYVLTGGIGFFRQPEIVELISFLSVIYNSYDSEDIHIYRAAKILGLIDEKLFNRIRRKALLQSKSVKLLLKEDMPELYGKFFGIIESYREEAKSTSVEKFIYRILSEFNFLKEAADDKSKAQLYRYFFDIVNDFSEHYEKLLKRSLKFSEFMENLYDLLSGFGKEIDVPFISDREAVKIMTVQQSKGERYKVVYMVDMVEDIFPREFFENPLIVSSESKTLDIIPDLGISARYEYEKRLFNVAATRATEEMFYCFFDIDDSGTPVEKSSFLPADLKEESLNDIIVDDFDLFMQIASAYSERERKEIAEILEGEIADRLKDIEEIINFDIKYIPDKVTEGLPDTYSYSKLENFVKCPRQFFYRYIAGLSGPDTIYKIIGIATHNILNRLYEDGNITYEKAIKKLNEFWEEQSFYSQFESRNVYTLIKEMLQNYIEFAEKENFKVISTEESFKTTIDGNNFTGRFDRVDKVKKDFERVVDYKTGNNVGGVRAQINSVKRGENFQIPLYSLARGCRYFSIYRLRELPGKIDVTIDFNDKDAAEALDTGIKAVKDTISKLQQGIFTPEENSACRVCYFKRICTVNESK